MHDLRPSLPTLLLALLSNTTNLHKIADTSSIRAVTSFLTGPTSRATTGSTLTENMLLVQPPVISPGACVSLGFEEHGSDLSGKAFADDVLNTNAVPKVV